MNSIADLGLLDSARLCAEVGITRQELCYMMRKHPDELEFVSYVGKVGNTRLWHAQTAPAMIRELLGRRRPHKKRGR